MPTVAKKMKCMPETSTNSFSTIGSKLSHLIEVRRKHKAEQLLLSSLKTCYPKWEEEGLTKKPR
jgi:hypothetical protein